MAANAYRNVFLSNVANIASSGSTYDLGIGVIGLFDTASWSAQTSPDFPAVKKLVIAQGKIDPNLPIGAGKSSFSIKTVPFGANEITRWEANKAQKPQNQIVTLGYDGVDTSKNFTVKKGKRLGVWITMSGQGIANLLGGAFGNHYKTFTQYFELDEPCIDACIDNCGEDFACNELVDNLIAQIEARNVIGNVPLTPKDGKSGFIKVSKVTSCDTPSGYNTETCAKWTLEVPDTGDQVALGVVQAQFPTAVRLSRVGTISTYEIVLCDGSTPADFDSTTLNLVPNCTTCPSGYALTSELPVFTITRNDEGTAATLATLKTDYAGLIVLSSAVITSHTPGITTYTVYGNSSTTLAQMEARNVAVAKGDAVAQAGTVQSVCVPTATDIAWVEGDSCTKAYQTWNITLQDTVCGTSRLAEVQAAYAGVGTVTEIGDGTCVHKFQIAILSNNASCEECADQDYTWTAPQPFEGTSWTIVPRGASVGCLCGLKVEGAYIARDRKECFFDAVSYEVEPLFVTISARNPDNTDFSQLCEDDIPVTVLQSPKYQIGYGQSIVADQVKLSKFYQLDQWRSDPATRDAYSYELGIDLNGYYDEAILEVKVPTEGSDNLGGFGYTQFETYELHFYYPTGNATNFISAINSYVSYPGSVIAPIAI